MVARGEVLRFKYIVSNLCVVLERFMKLFLSGCLIAGVLFGAEPAAQTEAPKRPKLGVALAGGAALGLAHVGVLQWLEEHRIPIDYIAGTSMGGLVSGMQATGMSSAEMVEFVSKVNWKLALSSSSPYPTWHSGGKRIKRRSRWR